MSVSDQKTLRSRATDMEALAARARKLSTPPTTGLPNGIKLLFVERIPSGSDTATLTLHFYNENYLQAVFKRFDVDKIPARRIFPLSGGHRLPAGPAAGMVQAQTIATDANPTVLHVTVQPVGDYSTYKLRLNTAEFVNPNLIVIDPLFNEIDFKFRPGCFNINCAPDWSPAPEPNDEPVIDYLAKDYDSFRHTMIAAMMQRVPNWQPSSEADLDQVLLELFSAAADELSDYQDRVMNEAYLSSARKRVSLARHARLMDYHIHQGNQASTWLALEVGAAFPSEPAVGSTVKYFMTKNFSVQTRMQGQSGPPVTFIARDRKRVHQLVNRMSIYTWGDAIPSLAAGDTTADLKLWLVNAADVATEANDKASAITVQELIRSGVIDQLLIQEHLNPVTGMINGYNPRKRQLLKLLSGADGGEAMYDPTTAPAGYDPVTDTPSNTAKWFVRVRWREQDALKNNYCFTVKCPDIGKIENVSLFHGNLVNVCHGRRQTAIFKEPGETLTPPNEFNYERLGKWGTICTLHDRPLAYLDTEPGGDEPTQSTLAVRVVQPGGGGDDWDEVSSLIHSDDSDENGDHFIVETDEESFSCIRFGNGKNGKELPENAIVECIYQIGEGLEGNIGLDKLITFDPAAVNFLKLDSNSVVPPDASTIIRCWNPFDVSNGRAAEPAAEIIRRAPEAYRLRQLRAVTLNDYVKRAEALPEVSRAAAAYAWTGSWRTVRITIDPVGTTVLEEPVVEKISRYLNAVRLIGEDLEIRPPQFVPLEINISLCAQAEFWSEDLKDVLEQEFSVGWTSDGRMGFFHPDRWTFGQSLRASQLIGRVLEVQGVEHLISLTMSRWNIPNSTADDMTVKPNEIIQVFDDPDHMEKGRIVWDVQGGRR
jgi:hypothetical protein